jgi:Cu2+-exporting ATPase
MAISLQSRSGAVAARPVEPRPEHEATSCFHCGLPVLERGRYTAVVDSVRRELCCAGCQAVTESILGAGLEAFYRSRAEARPVPGEGAPAPLEELAIYDRPEVQGAFVTTLADGSREATLLIEGITCPACVWLNEQHLQALPGVLAADINYATRRARVRWQQDAIRLSVILDAIQSIGYRAWPNDSEIAEQVARRERRSALWRLFVAAFGMMQVMMYAYPAYIAGEGEITADIASLLRWASLVLTVPVIVYSAAPFFRGALRDLRLRRLGMDVPVSLGVAAAFAGSAWATWTGRGEVYFDSITMFVFFLLAGRWLEYTARGKASEALRHLLRALPAKAQRLTDFPRSEAFETVPAGALAIGDAVLVRPGDAFPADGVVLKGDTRVDESLLTGESRPAAKSLGAAVTGGTANVAQPVVMRVERTGADTRLSAIVRLVERAHAERPAIVELADRYAGWFVAAVLAIALASLVIWLRIDPDRALMIAVAVLVVTCPCALSLATPAALAVATGTFARMGLVVTRERAIESLTRVTHVVMDKTGTLTEGTLAVVRTDVFDGFDAQQVLSLSAALEAGSDHPVARALRGECRTGSDDAVEVHHEAGAGVSGTVAGSRCRLGSRRHVEALGVVLPEVGAPDEHSEVWLAVDGRPAARFLLGDRLRPDAAAAVANLRALGLQVILASGDQANVVEAAARRCGIAQLHAGCSPEDKHARVEALQAQGAVVCMVGDGVNDAPVLARADVSVAMGGGAVLAQQSADLVLTGARMQTLVEGFEHARHTLRVMRQNLAWALAYNLVAVPLAATGLLSPWLAGLGMASSSLLVVVNALRLRKAPEHVATTLADAASVARA